MLSPRAIATRGYGISPRLAALRGYWPIPLVEAAGGPDEELPWTEAELAVVRSRYDVRVPQPPLPPFVQPLPPLVPPPSPFVQPLRGIELAPSLRGIELAPSLRGIELAPLTRPLPRRFEPAKSSDEDVSEVLAILLAITD